MAYFKLSVPQISRNEDNFNLSMPVNKDVENEDGVGLVESFSIESPAVKK